jgi:hypothetical protein
MTTHRKTYKEAGFTWPAREEWAAIRKRPPLCYMDRPIDDTAWAAELRRRAEIERVFGPVPCGDQAALDAAIAVAGWTPANTPLRIEEFMSVPRRRVDAPGAADSPKNDSI